MAVRLISAALFLSVLTPIAAAAETWPALGDAPQVEPSGTDDVAVLVGIEDYVFMPDIAGARQNVADWETFLRDGLGVETVLTLVNEQGVREELLDAAEKAVAEADEGSTVWFVFVGHGAPSGDGSDGFLVGADAQQNPKSIEARSLRRTELMAKLEAGPQKRTVILFDACFSGQDADGEPLAEGIQPVVPVAPVPTDAPGTVVLSAAQSDEYAGRLPGADRPAFSYLVLGGLRGWADDGDGQVTAAETVEYARRQLLALPGRRQTPQAVGLTNAVLTTGASEAPPSSQTVEQKTPVSDVAPDDPSEPTVVHWKNGGPVKPGAEEPSLVSLSAGGGLGGEITYENTTPLVDVLAGIRFGTRSSVRGVVGLSYFNRENPRSRVYDQLRSVVAQEFETSVPPLENGRTTHMLGLTVGPGFVHRPAAANLGMSIDGQLGIAVSPGGQCSEWGEDFKCADREGVLDPMFGLRLAGRFSYLEIAAVGRWVLTEEFEVNTEDGTSEEVPFSEVYAGMTLGVTFDL